MFRKHWAYIRRVSTRFTQFFALKLRPFFRFIGVATILASGWCAFLLLVSKPPIDPIPVLIMIWLSVLLLLFALFPGILDHIKRFKVKDFEIELQDTVSRSTLDDYISFPDLDKYTPSQQDNSFRNLENLLAQAIRQPSKPVLLVANLGGGKHVAIPMLFIYLFFLDIVGKSIIVLFVSTRQSLKDIAEITQDSVVGAVSGKTLLQTLYRRFPSFSRIFHIIGSPDSQFEEFLQRGPSRGEQRESVIREAYETLQRDRPNQTEFLTKRKVQNWLRGELNFRTVEVSLRHRDLETIREALAEGDDFILSIKDKGLRSVVSLCYFSKDISKKVLADIAQTK